jgi:hypothetical protein
MEIKIMIKVLKGWNGLKCDEIVEKIDRKGRNFGRGLNKKFEVSYKGQWHVVFHLPSSYGELEGSCIAIDRN